MKFYTIGYGGRKPDSFLSLLKQRRIRTVVDVRLYPSSGSMGIYKKAKDSSRGIQGLLAKAGIDYISLIELGNIFVVYKESWADLYRQFVNRVGDLLTERLMNAPQSHPQSYCLMCCEKRATHCHRKIIADYLIKQGHEIEHIE